MNVLKCKVNIVKVNIMTQTSRNPFIFSLLIMFITYIFLTLPLSFLLPMLKVVIFIDLAKFSYSKTKFL